MRIITLNTWGGKVYRPLMDFFTQHSESTDIFCLQEIFNSPSVRSELGDVRPKLFQDISKVLPHHQGYFTESQYNDEGLAIFIKKDITIKDHGDVFVYGHRHSNFGGNGKTMGRNLQYIQFELEETSCTVINFHGLWNGEGKRDSDDRIKQSKNIITFLEQTHGAKILSGDFNLEPETKSIALLENGMRNLIQENNITSTRSSFYTKDCKFADYTFVLPEIKVQHFEVMQDPVSDHLPMLLDFSLDE